MEVGFERSIAYRRWDSDYQGCFTDIGLPDRRLRSIVLQATAGMKLTEDERLKYTASTTEQEIVRGALGVKEAQGHVFGFFRQITNFNDLTWDLPQKKGAKDFVDLDEKGNPDQDARTGLNDLKERLHSSLRGNVHDEYKAKWINRPYNS